MLHCNFLIYFKTLFMGVFNHSWEDNYTVILLGLSMIRQNQSVINKPNVTVTIQAETQRKAYNTTVKMS